MTESSESQPSTMVAAPDVEEAPPPADDDDFGDFEDFVTSTSNPTSSTAPPASVDEVSVDVEVAPVEDRAFRAVTVATEASDAIVRHVEDETFDAFGVASTSTADVGNDDWAAFDASSNDHEPDDHVTDDGWTTTADDVIGEQGTSTTIIDEAAFLDAPSDPMNEEVPIFKPIESVATYP